MCLNSLKSGSQEISALLRSLQHYSQYPRHGSNRNVHPQRNEYRKCDLGNGILLSLTKEGNSAILDNVAAAGGQDANVKAARHRTNAASDMMNGKESHRSRAEWRLPGAGGGETGKNQGRGTKFELHKGSKS